MLWNKSEEKAVKMVFSLNFMASEINIKYGQLDIYFLILCYFFGWIAFQLFLQKIQIRVFVVKIYLT